jgi:purine-binding chemotaxis protein CheW
MGKNKLVKIETNELLLLISFELGSEQFGIDIKVVQEIIKLMQITNVYNSPEFVDGIINIRGKVIPVIDLHSKMGMPRKERDNNTSIVVVELEGITAGFIVDAVNEILRIPVNITEAPQEIAAGINSEYIKSVGKLEDRLLILIDLEKVLTKNEEFELQSYN